MATEIPYSDLVAGLSTDALVDGETLVSIVALVKTRCDSGKHTNWAIRSGGEAISSEELLGALTGFTDSIRKDLAEDWDNGPE